jgi:hypothetical protein
MDIHIPKPWRGLPEFLKEIGTIVIGVLIALGAGQVVEWLHWRELAQKTETDLAAGMQPNLLNAVYDLAMENCGEARISELAGALEKPGPDWRANPLPETGAAPGARVIPLVYIGLGRLWSHAAWENALASGVLNHMARDRVERYGDLYRRVEVLRERQTIENFAGSHLAALAFDRKLTDAEKANYLGLLSELELAQGGFSTGSRAILRDAHALGVDPPPHKVAAILKRMHETRGACVTDVKLPLS